jgi:putative Mg2+ transporter-C (MgtC) family protein
MAYLTSFWEVAAKLIVAVILGGIIGWEREVHDRPAGLRTHILVCVGSAVYMILSMSFPGESDPTRIAAQVATGMGFLGAGTIIRHGNAVRGLTTAASLWAIAAVGLCVGMGRDGYLIAITTTIFVFLTLRGLAWVEKLVSKRQYRQLHVQMRNARENFPRLQAILEKKGVEVRSCEVGEANAEGIQQVSCRLRLPPGIETDDLTGQLVAKEEILSVGWH